MSLQTQAILAAFLQEPTRQRYGLELAKESHLPSGTIYPILARLETQGLIDSAWEDIDPVQAGRRARRYYWLTGEGATEARAVLSATLERLAPTGGLSPRAARP
jgi:DNA-binding PadR family transcriptional regulator